MRGMGSVIDLGVTGARFNVRGGPPLNLFRTDAQALGNDWDKLAGDFHSAFRKGLMGGGEHVRAE